VLAVAPVVRAHLGLVVSRMVRFFSMLGRRRSPGGLTVRLLPVVILAVVTASAGCIEDDGRRAASLAEARAAVEREKSIRDGLNQELKRLEGERRFHLWRADIITGKVKPTLWLDGRKRPAARLLPTWGVRRAWRLWALEPEKMPWVDRAQGSLLRTDVERRYYKLMNDVALEIKAQEGRIVETQRYLGQLSDGDDGA
jgi:hypothetical protein